jgi:cathepsin A (carboxypeptidase C)
VANVLYLDSPAGVGYSYSLDGQFADDDRKLLKENHAALQAFYDEFTEFRNSQLYIGGSGYGGLQAILLADEIMQNITKSGIKLQGVVVGNPFLDEANMKNSTVYYAFDHGLIDESLWNSFQASCCQGGVCDFLSSSDQCRDVLEEVYNMIYDHGLNLYNIISQCNEYTPPDLQWEWAEVTGKGYSKMTCMNKTAETNYLRCVSVREALHISASSSLWTSCSTRVTGKFNRTVHSVKNNISNLVTDLPIADNPFKMLIYSGDQDLLFNFRATEQTIWSLGLTTSYKFRFWLYANQIVGSIKEWNDKLTVVTFNGAGHFVSESQPGAAQEMIKDFFIDIPIN